MIKLLNSAAFGKSRVSALVFSCFYQFLPASNMLFQKKELLIYLYLHPSILAEIQMVLSDGSGIALRDKQGPIHDKANTNFKVTTL